MRKRILNIIAIILTISIIFELYVFYNGSKENKVLETIQISDNLKETKQIAIKQQKEDFTWEDKGTSANEWPDIKTFEYYGSECTDAVGNNITPTTDVIQFDEQKQTATISTSKTIYCTLKFAIRSKVLELMTKTTNGTYLETYDGKTAEQLEQGATTEDELLRYVGTNDDVTSNKLNNFICFGTENIDECKNNKDTYMYRIIGITTNKVNTNLGLEKDQLKIIKATPPSDGTSVKWASDSINSQMLWDYETSNETTGATARWYLNSTSKFLGTITGKVGTHQWSDLITSEKWYKGDNTNAALTASELEILTSGSYKIGLMYASDFGNAFNTLRDDRSPSLNWLFIKNGMSGSSSTYSNTYEWTMTRYGLYYNDYRAWQVDMYADLNHYYLTGSNAVRPVFYLTRDISISGEGREDSPFIISDRIV